MTSDARRRVAVLGSTGSIGRQAVDVITTHPDLFEVVALVAGHDRDALAAQARALGVEVTGLGAEDAAAIAAGAEIDVVLNAVVGAAGLRASIAALRGGKTLALANKESLVAGGEACLDAAASGGGKIVPVDSEHAALAQCLHARKAQEVERVILTASGGPFRERDDLHLVTVKDALNHPTWSMGAKITIDSATMMNKGLEVIEAHHLFAFAYDRIDVVVHPQSIVHGAVCFADGSMILQAAPADMRIPILAALAWPERVASEIAPPDLASAGSLEFDEVDHERFPLVNIAYNAGRAARSYPAALNAANEEAVRAFLDETISFTDIAVVVEKVLAAHDPVDAHDLDAVLEVDAWARREARRVTGGSKPRSEDAEEGRA